MCAQIQAAHAIQLQTAPDGLSMTAARATNFYITLRLAMALNGPWAWHCDLGHLSQVGMKWGTDC